MEHLSCDEILSVMPELTPISSDVVADIKLIHFARYKLLQKADVHFNNYYYSMEAAQLKISARQR
jgi:hypothetical protein